MINNLGEGSIPKLMAKLAIPAVVAQVVNLLYNIVDRIYIGHIPQIGADALKSACSTDFSISFENSSIRSDTSFT